MTKDEVQAVVQEVLRSLPDATPDSDATVLRTVTAVLQSFGIDKDEHKEISEDLRYLRKWRKGAERVNGVVWTSAVTLIVGGIISALFIGFKAMVGK